MTAKTPNKICGKPACRIAVPHEHIMYVGDAPEKILPIKRPSENPEYKKITLPSISAIEEALRQQPAQDDPSAERFKKNVPETLSFPVWAKELLHRRQLSFWEAILAALLANLLTICMLVYAVVFAAQYPSILKFF